MAPGSLQFRRIRRKVASPLRGANNGGWLDRLILRLTDDSGRLSYGEVAPLPGFAVESVEEAARVLQSCEGDLGRLREALATRSTSLPCLQAALSMSDAWDEVRSFRGALPCAGLISEGEGVEVAAQLAALGYPTLKAKITTGEPGQRIREILAATPAGVKLRLDANGSLALAEAGNLVAWAMEEPRIEFIEQPLPPGHPGYAALDPTKVALDESFLNRASCSPEARDWRGFLVVKPSLAGDWTELRQYLGGHPSQKVVFSSALETAVGRQAGLFLAASLGAIPAVGFDTLGRMETDGWDIHVRGPMASGRDDIDWEGLWASLA